MRRPVLAALLALVLVAALSVEPVVAQVPPDAPPPSSPDSNDYAAAIFAGISNQGRTQRQPYVTAGDRTYLIGTQDGNFPDMGQHVPGEMGGLWLPPIKLIDAFQARIAEAETDQEVLLAAERGDGRLSAWQPVQVRPGAGRRRGRSLSVQSGSQARPDRPVPFQEHVGSYATVALSMVRQDRSAPRMVCGSSRNPGRSGCRRVACERWRLHRQGQRLTRGFASGVRRLPPMRGESSLHIRSTRTAAASRQRPVTWSQSAHTPLPR